MHRPSDRDVNWMSPVQGKSSPVQIKEPYGNLDMVTCRISSCNPEFTKYEGGSICNENPIITPSINALVFYAICQKKDQSVAVIMVYKTLFYLSKFNKLQTF